MFWNSEGPGEWGIPWCPVIRVVIRRAPYSKVTTGFYYSSTYYRTVIPKVINHKPARQALRTSPKSASLRARFPDAFVVINEEVCRRHAKPNKYFYIFFKYRYSIVLLWVWMPEVHSSSALVRSHSTVLSRELPVDYRY